MLRKSKPIDYLNDAPWRILVSIVCPLLLAYIVQVLISILTNKLNSLYIGEDYFTISGYLTTTLGFFSTIAFGVSSAAWIILSQHFTAEKASSIRQNLSSAVCAIGLITLSGTVIMIVLSRPILSLIHIPSPIFEKAQLYYCIYCLSFFPSSLSAFLLTVHNGTGSAKKLLLINLFTACNSAVLSLLILAVARMGLLGAAILPSANALTQILFYITLLKKDSLFSLQPIKKSSWTLINKTIKYGSIIAAQNLLCAVGYLVASMQANKYLSYEYISVLSISLPLYLVLDALSAAVTAFCPQNYAAGNNKRLLQFITLTASVGVLYGIFCFLVHICFGKAYFGMLFDDPVIVAYGISFWFWQGLGQPFVSIMYTIRFFLDAVGQSKLALLSGVGELIGNLLCAFWIIPKFGNIGASIAQPMGWMLGSIWLICAFFYVRKRILN